MLLNIVALCVYHILVDFTFRIIENTLIPLILKLIDVQYLAAACSIVQNVSWDENLYYSTFFIPPEQSMYVF